VQLGVLTQAEVENYIARERELEEILFDCEADSDDEEKENEDGLDDEDDWDKPVAAPKSSYCLEDATPERVQRIREIATSGRWLASTGHWLSHKAYGLLKDVLWTQEANPSEILECLDQRAAFVRQAYPVKVPNHPPIPEHGSELYEAAELLLKADGWTGAFADKVKRLEGAKKRFRECIAVCEPMNGGQSKEVVKAKKRLSALEEQRGQKRAWEEVLSTLGA
jgi:hypothetical protein